jgi:hypothetical protein
MKKIRISFLTLLLASSVIAATNGSIMISGNVNAATALVVTSETGYNALALSTGATNQKVATVREINNTANGYTLTLSSANAGKLRLGTQDINYSATYDNTSVNLTLAGVIVTNQGAQTSPINVTKDFKITFAGVDESLYMQGTYSDTLTFTIASK